MTTHVSGARAPKPVYSCLKKKTRTSNSRVTEPGFPKGVKHQPQTLAVIKTKEKQLTTEGE